ncbi:WYL domain-containing protein [Candidatus Enterococcus ferrettii]|uniref:WYL domain-containing protein n=1 Tax=Candidatus Enterococcus ferrettii TaxID=2815324 RepID=UPI0032220671
MQSILEEKRVQLLYKQYHTREVLLQIAELFYREGIWFCSALDVTNKQWGTYRCDYMEEIKIIENAEQTHTSGVASVSRVL